MRRTFGTALVRFLRRIVTRGFTNRYRPEQHYMRGPGPKSDGQNRPGAINGTGDEAHSPGSAVR
jgi:hypothetical protein